MDSQWRCNARALRAKQWTMTLLELEAMTLRSRRLLACLLSLVCASSVLAAKSPTPHFTATSKDDTRALLTVAPNAPDGMALLSVANPDDHQSNVLPLRIRALPQFTLPPQTGASIAAEGFRFTLTGSLNQFYLLEHSPDLEHRQRLSTNQFLGVPLDLLDPGATNARTRFYRARLEP
jgi:hypothetical protein